MANHNLPTSTSTYLNFIAEVSGRLVDAAVAFDPAFTTVTNPPTNTVRLNSSASRWERWNGTSWIAAIATWAINISGLAATATALATARAINGVNFNGTANITITANTPAAVTFAATGGAAPGSAFSGSALSVSYATVGAPGADGTGATGTWGISISGQAATALSLSATGTIPTGATAVTQAAKDATTKVATTAFVDRMRGLLSSATSGTLVLADRGCRVPITAGITVPAGVFAADDVVTIYNNTAGALTITQGAGMVLRLVGTATTGDRTLAPRGLATVVFHAAAEAVVSGGGLS